MSSANVVINGPAIREIRKGLGVSAAGMAQEVGVAYSYLVNIETGHNKAVSPDIFRRLVYALRIPDARAIIANPYGHYTWIAAPVVEDAVPAP